MPYSYVPRIAVLLALVGISHASSVSMYGQVSMQIDSEGFDGETPFALSGTRVPNTGSDFGSHIIDAQAIVIRPSNFTFWTMPSDDVLDSLASNSTAQETPWVAVISAGSMSTLQQAPGANRSSSESVSFAINQLALLAAPPAVIIISNINNSVSSTQLKYQTFDMRPPPTAIFNSVELRDVISSWQLLNDTDTISSNATSQGQNSVPILVDADEALISVWLFDRHVSNGPIVTPQPPESTTAKSNSIPPNGGLTTDRESTGFYARTVAFVAFCILSFFIFTLYCRIKLGIMQNEMNNQIWVLALGDNMSPTQLAVQKELVAAVVATMPTRTITAREAAGQPADDVKGGTNDVNLKAHVSNASDGVVRGTEVILAAGAGEGMVAESSLNDTESSHNDHVVVAMRSPSSTSDGKETCVICIEVYEAGDVVRELPCGHEFHVDCIDPWLADHHTCPLCKLDILESSVTPPSSPGWSSRGRRGTRDETMQGDIVMTPLNQSSMVEDNVEGTTISNNSGENGPRNSNSTGDNGIRESNGSLGAFQLTVGRAMGPPTAFDPAALSDSDESDYLQVHGDFE